MNVSLVKRIVSLVLIAALVLSALVACGGDGKKDDVTEDGGSEIGTETDAEKDAEKDDEKDDGKDDAEEKELELSDIIDVDAKPDIPESVRYDGYTCRVLCPEPYGPNRIVRDGLNGDPVNDATYNRNLAVEDALGVKVDKITLDSDLNTVAQKFIDDVLSGNHSFDFATVNSSMACSALIISNSVLPFEALEYVDFKKPWWNTGLNETCSVMGNNFFALSSICYGYYNNTACILFNKDLAKEHNLPDLYEIVRKGEWTVDKLIELTKNVSQDLDGDGMFTNADKLAIVSDDNSYINMWYGGFRQSTVEKGENDEPVSAVGTPRMSNVVDKLNTLFHTGRRGVVYELNDRVDGDDEWLRAFSENRILFDVTIVADAVNLRENDINFGILPFPKLNAEQERYGSFSDPWGLVLCVPIDCEDTERTGAIIEEMSYQSYRLIYPAMLYQCIYGTGTRDLESIEMLETIYDNMFFDFGFLFDSYGADGYSALLRTLVPLNSSDISSYVAERRNVAENHFSELYEAMKKNYAD